MRKDITLSKEYINVKRKENGVLSFGGDQNFFAKEDACELDIRKQKCGCGIVAFADLLLYLGTVKRCYLTEKTKSYVNHILSEEEYKKYYNQMYDFMGGIKGKVGISGLKIQRSFNRMARREHWSLRAKWGFSAKKLYSRIEEMLSRDIPVICCIPMMVLKKDKNDYLQLYQWQSNDTLQRTQRESMQKGELQKVAYTRAHYVVITGIHVIEEEIFYEVSSWGKKFYISRKEYDDFIRKHFLGILLGNILYIYQ